MLSVYSYLGRDTYIITYAKLLKTKYQFYGFSGDLIETIN